MRGPSAAATRTRAVLTLFLVLLIESGRPSGGGGADAARILGIFPVNVKSNFAIFETMMRALAGRGHLVDVVGHFPLEKPPPNYRDISIVGTMPRLTNNVSIKNGEDVAGLRNMIDSVSMSICNILNATEIRSIIENPPDDPPYDLVVLEIFATDCFLGFGRHLNVPTVGVASGEMHDWLTGPLGNPQSAAFVPNVFSSLNQRMSFHERLLNVLHSGFVNARYWYYASSRQLPYVEKHFGRKISSTSELYKDIGLLLVNSHPSFDFVRPLVPGIVQVGGLHISNDAPELTPEVGKWLNESTDGCVYFAFGSILKIETFPVETIKAFYETFERIAPVRVLVQIGNKNDLPEGLPKNVMTSPWLPQIRVLKHENVRAFVSHSGPLSTQEAIVYGVPIVGIPILSDHSRNSRICEEKRVAVTLNHWEITADSLTKALNTVLSDPSYGENAKRLGKLFTDRPTSPLNTALFWIGRVIRNGRVLESPGAELGWWQLESLDVHCFVVALLLLSIYAIGCSFRRIFDRILSKLTNRRDSGILGGDSFKWKKIL